jgi:4-hydroxy-tetrahydrodipicolinate synthase
MVELVDTPDLGSGAARCVGSSPILGIFLSFLITFQPLFGDSMKPGIYAASTTPLFANFNCDVETLVAHCQDLLNRGCQGIVLFGTTGEGPSFTVEERKKILKEVIDRGLNPESLILGVLCNTIDDAISLIQYAHEAGCNKILLAPPFYYKSDQEEGVLTFYREVLKRAGNSQLQVLLYHIPQFTGISITTKIVKTLVEEFPKTVVGLKESEGNLSLTQEILSKFPGFLVFVGNENHIQEAVRKGGAGSICGMANICPELICSLYTSDKETRKINALLIEIRKYPIFPAIKSLVEAKKGPQWHTMRPPLSPLTEQERQTLYSNVQPYLN